MIDLFREFIVLASCKSFAKAADQLHTTQSTLSRHTAELERELGFKLFDRNPLSLTEAGAFCLNAIVPVVNAYDKAIGESRAFAEQSREQLSVTMLTSTSDQAGIIYEAFAKLRQARPKLSLKILTDSSVDAYSSVVLGMSDVAFLATIPEVIPDGFICDTFATFKLELWGHRKGGLFEKQPVKLKDLEGYSLIASTNQSFAVWFNMQVVALKNRGLALPIHIRELNTLNEFALTLQPDEIMITPAGNHDPSSQANPDLKLITWGEEDLCSEYCVFYAQGSKEPLIRELLHFCRAIAADKGFEVVAS